MSGGSLPRTGLKATITLGGVAGIGYYHVPLPVIMAIIAVATVIVGALLIRVSFRRGRAASRR